MKTNPVAMFVNGEPACLVLAEQFLTSTQICDAYSEHTGFDRSTVRCFQFGHNVLQIDQKGHVEYCVAGAI
jgi:hypothetical protein